MYLANGEELGASAAPGRLLRIESRGPPWLTADHELWSVIVNAWPGRLWFVDVTDPVPSKDQIQGAPYTRATAVRIIREVNVAALFGERGAAVCAVIDRAHTLTQPAARDLAAAYPPEADQAYHRIWERWLERQPWRHPDLHARNFAGTLAIPARGGSEMQSPIGRGLLTIDNTLTKRAQVVLDDAALSDDPNDPEGALLVQPWADAEGALLAAALAFGTDDLISTTDRDLLSRAWRTVFGGDPP